MQTDYASVAALPEHEQSRVLESGDAPERLWAAWALALRHGRSALPTLAALSDTTLTEGLKRQLLVVLAGLGARSLLLTIATTDPSIEVRATATVYYIRTARRNDSEPTVKFVLDQLHTGTPELVLAILTEHETSRIDLPEHEVTACLRDPRSEIRQAAVNCILSKDSVSDSARDSLLRLLVGEESAQLREQLLDSVQRAVLPLLLKFLKEAPAKRIVEILVRLEQKFGLLSWAELSGITNLPEPLVVDAALRALDLPLQDEAIPWLGSVYQASMSHTDHTWQDIRWRIGHALRKSLSLKNVCYLGQEAIALFHQEIDAELAYFNSTSSEELEGNDYFEEDGVELAKLSAILSAAASTD